VKDPELWSENLAREMAKNQFEISLTDLHLQIILFVRDYYLKWEALPMVKTIRDRFEIDQEKLDELFKRGRSISRGVICRLSGLPRMLCISAGC
jgi:TusE/DsrC/DsvC family sulfur relay protein